MDTLKEAFPATNKKEWEKQTIRWLIRREKLLEFLLFQMWRKAKQHGLSLVVGTAISGSNTVHTMEREVNAGSPGGQIVKALQEVEPRRLRGGFASTAPVPKPQAPTPLPAINTRKRKRQINDMDEREERTSKRIVQSQKTYGLRELQDIALKPEKLTISAVQELYGLPNLLDKCIASNELPASIGPETVVEVWKSIRLQEPQRRFFHSVTWTRAQACPATEKEPGIADPVLFFNRDVNAGDEGLIRLHDCGVGRMRLIFRVAPTAPSAPSQVYAYIHTFRPIPKKTEEATNMFVITKPAQLRSQLMKINRIFRVCPLSPCFSGRAAAGVTPQTTLDHYNTFYINKYYSMSDFLFLIGYGY